LPFFGGPGGFTRERERELGGEKKVIGFVEEEVLGRSFYGNSLRYS
jgi:hypothetical protein